MEKVIIKDSRDITLGNAARAIGKLGGATLFKGAGLLAGTTKAIGAEILMAEDGSYIKECLEYSNRAHYRGSSISSFNYVRSALSSEKGATNNEEL